VTRATGKVAEATGHAPGAALGSDVAANLIEKHFKVTRTYVNRLSAALGQKRVVVFIDDLDRTDPKLLPKLLLALRELLDIEQFAFVLAFDREMVASAIEAHN
jgi:KAP family P-loop domain